MDGTLVNSEHLHIEAWKKMFIEYGIDLGMDGLHTYIGVSDVNICKDISDRFDLTYTADEILARKRHYFRTYEQQNVQLIEGVSQGLKRIHGFLPMAVATMSSDYEAEKSLEYTGIRKYFEAVVSADHVHNHKPAPDCYWMACETLGIEPQYCIGIEDSVSGISASKNAGLFTIAVANTLSSDFLTHADLVLENSQAAFSYLEQYINL